MHLSTVHILNLVETIRTPCSYSRLYCWSYLQKDVIFVLVRVIIKHVESVTQLYQYYLFMRILARRFDLNELKETLLYVPYQFHYNCSSNVHLHCVMSEWKRVPTIYVSDLILLVLYLFFKQCLLNALAANKESFLLGQKRTSV